MTKFVALTLKNHQALANLWTQASLPSTIPVVKLWLCLWSQGRYNRGGRGTVHQNGFNGLLSRDFPI